MPQRAKEVNESGWMRRRFTQAAMAPKPPPARVLIPRRSLLSRNEVIEISSGDSSDFVNITSSDSTADRSDSNYEQPPPSYESVALQQRPEISKKTLTDRKYAVNSRKLFGLEHLMQPPVSDLNVDAPWLIQMTTPVQDAFIYAEHIPKLEVPKEIFSGNDFAIFITQVHSPFKFWFNIHFDDSSSDILELFSDMHLFYSEEAGQEYEIIPIAVVPGRACAALFDNVWHRGEILTHLDEQEMCKVFFIDFGTVWNVNMKDICYLKSCFGKLPRQALRGRLALVAPPKADLCWKFSAHCDATHTLSQIVSDRLLHAFLYAYEDAEEIFHLVVTDQSYPVALNVNEELSVKKMAQYVKTKNDVFPHFDEIVPTFEMLEKGIYPPYSTLVLGNQMTIYNEFCDSHPEAMKIKKTRRMIVPEKFADKLKEAPPPPYSEKPLSLKNSPVKTSNETSKPSTSSSSVSSVSSVKRQSETVSIVKNPFKNQSSKLEIKEVQKVSHEPKFQKPSLVDPQAEHVRNTYAKRASVPEPRPLKSDIAKIATTVVQESVKTENPPTKTNRLRNMIKEMHISTYDIFTESNTEKAQEPIQDKNEQSMQKVEITPQEPSEKAATNENQPAQKPMQPEPKVKTSKNRMVRRLLELMAEADE